MSCMYAVILWLYVSHHFKRCDLSRLCIENVLHFHPTGIYCNLKWISFSYYDHCLSMSLNFDIKSQQRLNRNVGGSDFEVSNTLLPKTIEITSSERH